jgi:hypothetical protein
MNKVTVICPIYNTFPEIVGSMINQTHKNWCLLLIHDGPNSTNLRQLINIIGDERIRFVETEERKEYWGHPIRKIAIESIDKLAPETDYIVVTNPDNHYVPHYCEYLLQGFKNPSIVASYCSQFIHAYESWQKTTIIENITKIQKDIEWEVYKYGIIDSRLKLGYIDAGCVMVRKDVAKEIGWNSLKHEADWDFFNDIIQKYGEQSWALVRGCLFVHN